MRTGTIPLLAVGLMLAACADGGGPSADGTLVVSTSTGGGDPDQDGYLLTVDDLDSLTLHPTGASEVLLRSGQHTLRLFGVAEHCSVVQGALLKVDVPSQGTVSVAFEVSCPASAARITTTTTGLDIDPNGYRVVVDGTDQGGIPSNGTVLTRLDPGSRTIALTDLSPNCTINGDATRTVTVVDPEIVPVEFAVVCTATRSIGTVRITGPTTGQLPGSTRYEVWYESFGYWDYGSSDSTFLGSLDPNGTLIAEMAASNTVSGGDPYWYNFWLSNVPANCRVQNPNANPAPGFTITPGDTLDVEFAVACSP